MSRKKFALMLVLVIIISSLTFNIIHAQEPLQENHDPVITSFDFYPNVVHVMSPFDAIVTFSDPDLDDTHVITFDWGDGSSDSGSEASRTHIYTEPGLYLLSVTIEDNEGGIITMVNPSKVVVIDTLAGFTSGGGWITCPHDITGEPARGYFGFVAKYHKGEVKGNVVFHIKDGLRFKSTMIRWLVVTGDYRVINGRGVINGETECIFTVKVRDGGEGDGFDIILVEPGSFDIIYDSYVSPNYSTYYTVIPLNGGSVNTHNPPGQSNGGSQNEVSVTKHVSEAPTPKENNGNAYGKNKNQNSDKSNNKNKNKNAE